MGATTSKTNEYNNGCTNACQPCYNNNAGMVWPFAKNSSNNSKNANQAGKAKQPKVVIIGDRESGKTTLVKQIMLLHSIIAKHANHQEESKVANEDEEETMTIHERSAWKTIITLYIVKSLRTLLQDIVPDSQYEPVARLVQFRANSLKDFDRKWRQFIAQDVLAVIMNPNFASVHKYANQRLR